MPRSSLLHLAVDPADRLPVYQQLYRQLRQRIRAGTLPPGTRLPATRLLASELGLSRNTVAAAYDQLAGEGYIAGRVGAGMFVGVLPDPAPATRAEAPSESVPAASARSASGSPRPFQPGVPDLRLFPREAWARQLARSWRRQGSASSDGVFAGQETQGDPALRAAIARHLFEWRGIAAGPDDIFVTAGSGDGIELVLRALALSGPGFSSATGRPVALENPGYPPLYRMVELFGRNCLSVPVDADGLDVAELARAPVPPVMAIVTPSRHFPLGHAMKLPRRLQLLEWATANDGLVLEDDYDSEYRFAGHPLEALAALDSSQRVIYAGSFSKIFSPGIRLGYLVVPPRLQAAVAAALRAFGPRASAHLQPALAAFLDDGSFAQHLRRTRRIYAARQAALVQLFKHEFAGLLELEPHPSGLHLVARLAPELAVNFDDVALSGLAAGVGIVAQPLSGYCRPPLLQQGLLLGYAAFTPDELQAAAMRLKGVLTCPKA